MLKKLVAIVLLCCLSLSAVAVPPKRAEAAIPFAALGYYGVIALAGCATAYGISFADTSSIEAGVKSIWDKISSTGQSAWKTAVDNYLLVGGTTLLVTDFMWQTFRDGFQASEFVSQAGTGIIHHDTVSGLGFSAGYDYAAMKFIVFNDYDLRNSTIIYRSSNGPARRWIIGLGRTDGSLSYHDNFYYSSQELAVAALNSMYIAYVSDLSCPTPELFNSRLINGSRDYAVLGLYVHDTFMTHQSLMYYGSTYATKPWAALNYVVKYDASATVLNPTYDWVNTGTEQRAVLLPPTGMSNEELLASISALIGATADTIINANLGSGTYNPPIAPAEDYSGLFGWLSSLWYALQNLIGQLSDIITSLSSTWKTSGKEIDWDHLTDVGTTFTTTFPFSLPWDLYNAVQSISLSPDAAPPTFEVVLPNYLSGGTLVKASFTLPDSFMAFLPFVRSAFLMLFSISLILLTRKLLGGAI